MSTEDLKRCFLPDSEINGRLPGKEELCRLYDELPENGKLMLTVKNRYSLFLMNGASPFGKSPFSSFYGADDERMVSLPLLKDRLEEAVPGKYRIFYPFPSAEDASVIFTDERLPHAGETESIQFSGEMSGRVKLFDVKAAAERMAADGVFQPHADSFIVIIEKDPSPDRLMYVKYSNHRDRRFNIRTEIVLKDGRLLVRKLADCEEARKHAEGIADLAEMLSEKLALSVFSLPSSRKLDGGTECHYAEGKPLDLILDGLLEKGDRAAFDEVIEKYVSQMNRVMGNEDFSISEGFREIFGDIELPAGLKGSKGCDVDLIFQNIIEAVDGRWEVIDYEWTFPEISVPVDFVIYRALSYFYYQSRLFREAERLDLSLQKYGISSEEAEVFEKMERSLQAYITKGASSGAEQEASDEKPGDSSFGNLLFHIYFDHGDGFEETGSIEKEFTLLGGEVGGEFIVPEGAKKVRLDPSDEPCEIGVLDFSGVKEDSSVSISFETDGIKSASDEKLFSFPDDDPKFILEAEGLKKIIFKLSYRRIPESTAAILKKDDYDVADLSRQLAAEKERYRVLSEEHDRVGKELIEKSDEVVRLNYEIGNLNASLTVATGDNKAKQKAIEDREAMIAERDAMLAESGALIDDIYSSLSWKITKPLRVFKKIKKGKADGEKTD